MKPTKIKVGSTAIRIYHNKSNGYPLHTVAWHIGEGRQRKTFADAEEADRYARLTVAPAIRKGELAALKLTGSDREAYVHAMELLRPLGIPLSVAIEDYVKRKAGTSDKPVAEVVKELLAARSGKSPRYQESLRSHLNRFAETFHYSIGGVTTAMIVGWLDRLKLSPRGRKNARQSVVTLFHFARSRGYLPKHVPTEADDVETIKENETEIGMLTPAQLSKLLELVDDKIALYLVLGAFTGIRSAVRLLSLLIFDAALLSRAANVVAEQRPFGLLGCLLRSYGTENKRPRRAGSNHQVWLLASWRDEGGLLATTTATFGVF